MVVGRTRRRSSSRRALRSVARRAPTSVANRKARRSTNRKVRRKFGGSGLKVDHGAPLARGEVERVIVDDAGRMIVTNPRARFEAFEDARCSIDAFKENLTAGKTKAMGPGALYTIWNEERDSVGSLPGGAMTDDQYTQLARVHEAHPEALHAPKANGAFYLNHPDNNNILVTLGCGQEYFSEAGQEANGGRGDEPVNGGYSHLIVHYYKIYQETLYHLLINPAEALDNLNEFLGILYETLSHHLRFGHPGLFGLSKNPDGYTPEEIKGFIQDRIYLHCPPTLKRIHFHVVIGGDKVSPTPLGMKNANRHFKLSDLMTVLATPEECRALYEDTNKAEYDHLTSISYTRDDAMGFRSATADRDEPAEPALRPPAAAAKKKAKWAPPGGRKSPRWYG